MLTPSSDAVDHRAPTGSVTGPPIVFVHGFCSSAEQDWPPTQWAKPYADAGRETLAVRLPGHIGGPVVSSAADVSTKRVLTWIAESVRAVTSDTVDLVGYSLGARLAWDLAGTSGLPVRRLVLGGLSPSEPFTQLDLGALRSTVHGESEPADPLTAGLAQMVAQSGGDTDSLVRLVEGLAHEPFEPAAQPPTVPTLLVGGDNDAMVQGIDELADIPPDAQLCRVPGDHQEALAGESFRAAVSDFLRIRA